MIAAAREHFHLQRSSKRTNSISQLIEKYVIIGSRIMNVCLINLSLIGLFVRQCAGLGGNCAGCFARYDWYGVGGELFGRR